MSNISIISQVYFPLDSPLAADSRFYPPPKGSYNLAYDIAYHTLQHTHTHTYISYRVRTKNLINATGLTDSKIPCEQF